jgi:plasmid replication initiation protein
MTTKHTPKVGTALSIEERHVNMSNALARASHGLSLSEKRVIACGIASTNSDSARDYNLAVLKGGGWVIRVTAAEYSETFGVSMKNAYDELQYVAKALTERSWQTVEGKKSKTITRYPWVAKSEYQEKMGSLLLEFTHYTAPHLLAQKKNFTSYKLARTGALRSTYSWRLFDCLESWKFTGMWHVLIDDFHQAMDTPPSAKENFGMLRRSVIEPAIREIQNTQNMTIDCEVLKTGRKVSSLKFTFEPNPQTSLFEGVSNA